MHRGRGYVEISASASQLCCDLKTALKNKDLFKKMGNKGIGMITQNEVIKITTAF